jgi:gliding motility-associated-like protein
MRKFILLSIVSIISISSFSQDFSNKGKEFWLAYSYHVGMVNPGEAPVMTLYITTDVTTNYTVEIFGVTTLQTGVINANQVISVIVPNSYFINSDGLFTGRTVHVTGVKPIVVYAFITRTNASAATLCLPTNVLGKEYYAASFTQISNEANASSFITIVAIEDNTNIEITPTAATKGGWLAGSTHVITLNKGQVYQVLGTTTGSNGVDLSGTTVKSIASGSGGCKKLAVFSGSGKLALGCSSGSADNLYQQLYPVASWGKKYLTVPSYNRPNNYFRIMRSNLSTNVYLNGVLVPAASFTNNYYQFINNTPNLIESDLPVSVTQYFTSQNCLTNGSPYDPDMIALNPVEQNINKVTLVNSPLTVLPPPAHQHHLHLVMRNGGTGQSSFTFDGTSIPPSSWVIHPRDANYSYLYLANVAQGNHTLYSDSGFNALAYGYGSAESYGYSAGANVKDLYQQIGVTSLYGIENLPSVCTGSPFKFKVSLPYCVDSIRWNLSNLPGPPSPSSELISYSSCSVGTGGPDSTTTVNGKTLYWYSLPSFYTFNLIGSYPVTITTYTTTASTCGTEQDIEFDLQVSDPPVANFTWGNSSCVAEAVQFNETTPQSPKPTYHFWWDFGDPASGANNTSNARNPTHLFSAPGTYNVRFSDITTPGCLSDTILHQVIVAPLPSATIMGTSSVCINAPNPTITFTATNGTAPYTFTYNINGGANQTLTTITGNSITIAAPTNIAGTFTYNLVSVKNAGSTLCIQNQSGSAVVIVNPMPTASIAGNIIVCLNAPMPNVTFTGASGTAPYTFTYNINGGPNLIAITTVGNSVDVPVPTTTAGTFIYNLLSVSDGTSSICSQNQTGTATVVVKDLPTAIISGNTTVCLNATSPNITFTGAVGTAPYTFTYTVNGGANQIVTTTVGNSVTVAVPTAAVGNFVYSLVNVTEGSANACIQLQSGIATVIVNPLPSANISGTTTLCLNEALPNITFTGSGSMAPYSFTYNINGGANQTVTTTSGNTVTVAAPTNIAGTFIYNLISVQDGSTTACTRTQSGSVSVVIKSLPTAIIAGTTSACLNAVSPNITFSAATGIAPYTFTYNINGGANQTVTTTVGNAVTVAVPTTSTGIFTYNLLSVQEGSANACSQIQSGNAIVTINPLPTANISGATAVCLNAPMPNVTFTGAAGAAPYTFTYNINGGTNQTVTTTAGNTVTVAAPTNVAGTFTYNLISVRDASSSVCSQAQAGNVVIIIHPLPSPDFSYTIPSCETRLITFTDNSVPNVGTLSNWSWNFNDPISGTNNSSNQPNPTHVFSTAGNYNVSLTITTSNGCSNALPFIKLVPIHDRPLAGYIIPEVCLSDTYAQFLDTTKLASGTLSTWAWNFGDLNSTVPNPNTSVLQNPTHSYTAVGTYVVQLIATSNFGCKDSISQNLVVNGSFPVANFTVNNPTTLCANDSVAIVNTSTVFPGTITKVEIYWDNGNFPAVFQTDDYPYSGKIYRHLYPNFQTPLTKIFSIRYRAYSGGVCVNDKISTITVNAAPRVQFNNIPDACLDAAPFLITQASEVGGVPGTFAYTGPGISSAAGMFNPALAGVGIHTIKYTFTSTAAGCVDTLSSTVKVLDTATARFSFITPVCDGSAATFKEESTAPVGVILNNSTWNFGDGSPIETHAPGSTFTHTFPAWGNFTVTMYNTSAYGCKSTSKQQQIFISPIPQTFFSFGQSSVCLPNAFVSFVNNTTIADGTENALTYLWDFGDPASGSQNTSVAKNPPAHLYSSIGPYTVRLTVTSGSNCIKYFTSAVNFIHPQPHADFDFNKPSVCIKDDVTFRDLTNGLDGTVNQWNWKFGDGNADVIRNPTHLYTAPGTYNVSLYIINSQGCNSDTMSKPFTVYPYPVVSAGPDRVVLQGGSIIIQSVVTGNNLQYLWAPTTYLNSVTTATPTASNMQDDITYKLTVTAIGGCKTEDEVFVKVLKAPKIPNTFSPNNDGINENWIIEYLDTYPDNRVQVFTRAGQLVFESRGYKTPWNGTMNGKTLPIDTYYYIIEPGTGRKPITGYVTILK